MKDNNPLSGGSLALKPRTCRSLRSPSSFESIYTILRSSYPSRLVAPYILKWAPRSIAGSLTFTALPSFAFSACLPYRNQPGGIGILSSLHWLGVARMRDLPYQRPGLRGERWQSQKHNLKLSRIQHKAFHASFGLLLTRWIAIGNNAVRQGSD